MSTKRVPKESGKAIKILDINIPFQEDSPNVFFSLDTKAFAERKAAALIKCSIQIEKSNFRFQEFLKGESTYHKPMNKNWP